MKKYVFLFLFFSISSLSCKKEKESANEIAELGTTSKFRPDWVDKVGAKAFKLKEDVFYVNDYGAVDDGSQLTTQAIQKAIDACSENGGGKVTFIPGIY